MSTGYDRTWSPQTDDAEILDDLGEQAGADLYPVGMVDRRSRYLAMADDGAVYMGMDSVSLWATTPDEALAKLTRLVRPEALTEQGRLHDR